MTIGDAVAKMRTEAFLVGVDSFEGKRWLECAQVVEKQTQLLDMLIPPELVAEVEAERKRRIARGEPR